MCLNIYVASDKELPLIPWSDARPGFYTGKVSDQEIIAMLDTVFQFGHYYEVGSHMGCSCGLAYSEWSPTPDEKHEQRVQDVSDFKSYLGKHLPGNTLRIFCTYWDAFPSFYPVRRFVLSEPSPLEFSFEEEAVLFVEK